MVALFYILCILAANIITASFAPLNLGAFIVPWGTFLIGATFVLRDRVQIQHGRPAAYLLIALALILSAVSSVMLGDGLAVVSASAISFLVSESIDTEIFTRLKGSLFARVSLSGTVGGLLDSGIFVVLGLSPIGAGFLPWEAVPLAISGQWIVKTALQFIGASLLRK